MTGRSRSAVHPNPVTPHTHLTPRPNPPTRPSGLPISEVAKLLGRLHSELGPEEKQEYTRRATRDTLRFNKEVNAIRELEFRAEKEKKREERPLATLKVCVRAGPAARVIARGEPSDMCLRVIVLLCRLCYYLLPGQERRACVAATGVGVVCPA